MEVFIYEAGKLTPCSRVLSEELVVPLLVSPCFMEHLLAC